jgi:diacylglycerol kinase family enzyme
MLALLIISQPLFAAVVLAVALAFLTTSIAALVTAGPRRAMLALAAVALVSTEAALVVLWGPSRDLAAWVGPLAFALLGAGFGLGRYALKLPAPELPADTRTTSSRARPGSVLFVNPQAGRRRIEQTGLVEQARSMGIRTVVLDEGDDLEALARRAAEDGCEVLGVAGGDGSLGGVLAIAVEHGLPFVCVPAGTRNHLALDLGLDRRDPTRALHAFTDGELRHIDYATVNGRAFVNNVSLGLYAAIAQRDGYRQAKLQTALELLPRLVETGAPWFDLHYEVPDAGHKKSATVLLVSNNPYELAGGSIQRNRLDGAKLGVIALESTSVRDVVGATLLTAAGRPDAARALWRWDEPEVTIGSPHPSVIAGVDGEPVRLEPPLHLAIVPQGAQVLVPPGSRVGLDEQQWAGGGARFAGLLEVAFDIPSAEAPATNRRPSRRRLRPGEPRRDRPRPPAP